MWPFSRPRLDALPEAPPEPRSDELEARMDVFSNVVTGLQAQNSKTACNRWQLQLSRTEQLLENIYQFDPVAARIIDKESQDALQKGFKVDGLDEDAQKSLDSYNGERAFVSKFDLARKWERLFGGALLFLDIDDGQYLPDGSVDTSMPVNVDAIRTIGQMTVLSRWDVTVDQFIADPETGDLVTPAYYRLNNTQQQIHPSRVIKFGGFHLTWEQLRNNQGWGGSVMDRVFRALERKDTTQQYLAEAITRITQGVFKMKGVALAGKSEAKARLMTRMKQIGQFMGLLGDVLIDEGEEYNIIQRGVQGFKDAADVFVSALVAATDMPRSILLGETPGGLNSGENAGDWQAWTSHLSGVQVSVYDPRVEQYLELVFASQDSPVAAPEEWSIQWPQLFQVSATDEASILAQTAQATVSLRAQRIITTNEARSNEVIAAAYPEREETSEELGEEEPDDRVLEMLRGMQFGGGPPGDEPPSAGDDDRQQAESA